MIFSRAMQVAFINIRIIRAGRFMPRIAGAAVLVAGVSAAVAFPAGSAVAQVSATRTPALHADTRRHQPGRRRAGSGSLRAAIDSANATSAGDSTLITFAVNGTITLASPLPAIVRTVEIDATSAPTYGQWRPAGRSARLPPESRPAICRRLGRLGAAGSSRRRRQRQWRNTGRPIGHAQRQLHRPEPGRGRGRQRQQRRVRLGHVDPGTSSG